MAMFQLDPQSIAARVRTSDTVTPLPTFAASVCRGIVGFTIVSVAGFLPWPIFELWFRGPHVCRGYWHNPEATAAALDKKGWFRTGDQALCDEDGYYYVVGRTIDMFISGGVNVYPAEVERELEQHPGIQETAVIGVHHPTWGEVGVAFIVTRPGQNLTDELLAEFLSERLAKYKIPKEFFFVEALPRNAYGKIAKAELREKYETVKAAGAGIV